MSTSSGTLLPHVESSSTAYLVCSVVSIYLGLNPLSGDCVMCLQIPLDRFAQLLTKYCDAFQL